MFSTYFSMLSNGMVPLTPRHLTDFYAFLDLKNVTGTWNDHTQASPRNFDLGAGCDDRYLN